jgi:hypothetical protein
MVGEAGRADGGAAGLCAFPHQTGFACPKRRFDPVPGRRAPERAVLAANMETALNILWDSGAGRATGSRWWGGRRGGAGGLPCRALPGAEVTC